MYTTIQDCIITWLEIILTNLVPLHISNLTSAAVTFDSNDDTIEVVDEEIYVKTIMRNFQDIYHWNKRKDMKNDENVYSISKTILFSTMYFISKLCSRLTRIAMTAPKALVLLLVPSILTNLPAEAEAFNGISTVAQNPNFQVRTIFCISPCINFLQSCLSRLLSSHLHCNLFKSYLKFSTIYLHL